jgi:CRISPR-associated protein Csx10
LDASQAEAQLSSTDSPKLIADSPAAKLAKDMAKRLLRQKLDEKLRQQVGRINLQGSITNSQLSRLIIIARQALNERNINLVGEVLENFPSNASGQFENTRIDGKPLDQKIKEWLKKEWLSDVQPVNIAGETYSLSDDKNLANEYTLLLIMAVAKKATKEKIYE